MNVRKAPNLGEEVACPLYVLAVTQKEKGAKVSSSENIILSLQYKRCITGLEILIPTRRPRTHRHHVETVGAGKATDAVCA